MAERPLPELPRRYRAIRWLGRGGSADVVLATDSAGEPRQKAVKILRTDAAAAGVAALGDEFRILASLEHPGLARVFDFGTLPDGRPYYTAEVVEGRELDEMEDPSARDVCLALGAVCRTLAYLHARGYVHNDVKPSNILIASGPGSARLLDFGLAGLDRAAQRTVAGTPGYIAPERLAGRAWDGRADLYAVGATLYRILGGRRVTEREDPTRALDEQRAGIPSLRALRPDVPAPVAALCDRLLAVDPGARPRRAEEAVALLGQAIGQAIPLETPGTARCYALASLMVGRDNEMASIEQAITSARAAGAPRIVAIAGGPGMGKSRLAREAAWRAETQGWRAGTIAATPEALGDEPFRRIAEQIDVEVGAPAGVGGPADVEIGPAGLAWIDALPGRLPPRSLLIVDDAHRGADALWAGAFAIARGIRARRLEALVVLAFDPDAMPASARRWLALGAESGEIARVDLPSLSAPALREMLASLFGPGVIPDAAVDRIAQRAAGSPLLCEEVVREMVDTGAIRAGTAGWTLAPVREDTAPSARIEDYLRRRSAALPADARPALQALAALGGRATPAAIAAVLGPAVDAGLSVALLVDRGLASRGEGEVEVTLAGESLGEIAFEGVAAPRRRQWFRLAARQLESSGAGHAALAVAHREAGEMRTAFDHALAAGRQARAAGEGRLAVRWLEDAAALLDAGDTDGDTPIDAAGSVDAATRADLWRELGRALDMVGRFAEALAMLDRAFALLPKGAARDRVRLASVAVRTATRSMDFASAEAWLARGSIDRAAGDRLIETLCERMAGQIAMRRRELRSARAHWRTALEGIEALPADGETLEQRVLLLAALASLESRLDPAAAVELARRGVAAAQELGDRFLIALAHNNAAVAHALGGRWAPAADGFARACELLEATGSFSFLPLVLGNLACVEVERGHWAEAAPLMERAEKLAASFGFMSANIHSSRARFAWTADDFAGAGAAAQAALADVQPLDSVSEILFLAAAAAAEAGDGRAAAEFAARAEPEREVSPLDRGWVEVARAYAVAATDAARGGQALVAAADALASEGMRAETAPLLRDAGRWLARGGLRAEADACLERARAVMEAAGNRPGLDGLAALRDRIDDAFAAFSRALTGRSEGAADAARGSARDIGRGVGDLTATVRAIARQDERFLELTLGKVELRRAFPGVVGDSPALGKALALLDRLADSDVPVLVTGATGTGKEIFARALHAAGPRADKPFVAFNCAAVPASLFEAELFGYRRGAFTGATQDHKGLVAEADGGTLFIDEIAELPPALQPKLLRLLDNRKVRAVGGEEDVVVDFRLVTATNRDLAVEVDAKRFRADLYYRLNVAEIALPALRDRLGDLPDLCRHLLERHSRGAQAIRPEAMKMLMRHAWPGNIRELDNELQRASVLAGEGPIGAQHLSTKLRRMGGPRTVTVGTRGSFVDRVNAFEREVIRETLRRHDGNQVHTAEALGMTRQGLRLAMIRLGLHTPRPRRRRA